MNRLYTVLSLQNVLLAGVLINAALVVYGIAVYLKGLPTAPDEVLVLVIMIGLLLVYGAAAVIRAGRKRRAQVNHQAILFGILAGTMWVGEVLAGNLGDTPILGNLRSDNPGVYGLIGRGFILLALLMSVLAGFRATRETRQRSDGIRAGLWSGMIGALITLMTLQLMTYVFMSALQGSPSDLREFARSGETDMAVFLVKDALTAGTAHLMIGIVTGLVLGAVGSVFGL